MKWEELQEGEIYSVYYQNDTYIVKKIRNSCPNLMIKSKSFYESGGTFSIVEDGYTLATPEEKLWLEECLEKRHFIEKPKTPYYEIY